MPDWDRQVKLDLVMGAIIDACGGCPKIFLVNINELLSIISVGVDLLMYHSFGIMFIIVVPNLSFIVTVMFLKNDLMGIIGRELVNMLVLDIEIRQTCSCSLFLLSV